MNYFAENSKIIGRRWPKILKHLEAQDIASVPAELVEGLSSTLSINGIQLTSRHDREAEAKAVIAKLTENDLGVAVYGVGLGDIPRQLLKNKKLINIHVFIMNSAIFSLLLNLTEQMDWLKNPRVMLRLPDPAVPTLVSPYVFLPQELELADSLAAKARDRIMIHMRTPGNNEAFFSQEIKDRINDNFKLLQRDLSVEGLASYAVDREVYILATGPTLADNLEKLKEVRQKEDRPLFFALDTALKPLMAYGIKPDFVMTVDFNITSEILVPELSMDINLVYIPMVARKVLEQWRGPRYGAYEAGNKNYDELKKTLTRVELFMGGSVIHPAVDVAIKMGAKKITLFGADFAYPYDKTHTGWDDGTIGSKATYGRRQVINGRGQQVRTLLSFCTYLNNMEHLITLNPGVSFLNASREGAFIQGTTYNQEFVADD
ncbi:MAG: motility associated factor glycosyltransferase family protein [Shewanella sp.]|uniref:motility associated factor glycosyltransferase family protein n=1 Tax=Shewanella sp. TaxID=50422 RepID=UPI003F3AA500